MTKKHEPTLGEWLSGKCPSIGRTRERAVSLESPGRELDLVLGQMQPPKP
jgi:hypothetical protein